jgi:hypothetical protein
VRPRAAGRRARDRDLAPRQREGRHLDRHPAAPVAAALLVTGSVALAIWHPAPLRAAWHGARLRHWDDVAESSLDFEALLALGESGRRALERVAFSREVARPGEARTEIRQRALDLLWAKDALARPPAERLLRYVAEARGLRRNGDGLPGPLEAALELDRTARVPAIAAAALDVVLSDPDRDAASLCLAHLVEMRETEALRLVIRDAPDERDRVLAAASLALEGDAAGLGTLVARCLRGVDDYETLRAAMAIEALGDRRAIAALLPLARSAGEGGGAFEAAARALATLTGRDLAPGETWDAFWAAHRADFPPQIE